MKRILFALVAMVSFVTAWALPPEPENPTITLTKSSVTYNGTATEIPVKVEGVNKPEDWIVYAVTNTPNPDVEPAFPAGGPAELKNYVPTLPTSGSTWYAWVGKDRNGTKLVSEGFTINKRTLQIELLELHKTYGDPDPVLSFDGAEEGSLPITRWAMVNGWAPGDEGNVTITGIQLMRIKTGETAFEEDGSQIEYGYRLNDETLGASCEYYDVGVSQTSTLLIKKAPLKIKVTDYWKEFKEDDPEFDAWTIVDETQLKNGDKAADIEITITRPTAGTVAGEAVNATLANGVAVLNEGANGYAFEGESQNYNIIFDNAFAIVPTDNIDGVTVTVQNNALTSKLAEYTYTAAPIEPGKEPLVADLVVTDGDYTLVYGTDYEVKSYDGNIHVAYDDDGNVIAGATVTVTLKGSYSGGTKSGSFKINKAPLSIYANDVNLQLGDAEPTEFTVSYEGWQGNDREETSGDFVKAKGFKAPSGVTKVQIPGSTGFELAVNEDAEADDYEISYEKGLMSYGQTTLHVWSTRMTKVYGEKDPEEYIVKVTTRNNYNAQSATPTQIAALTIGGKKVYTLTRAAGEDVLLGGLLGYSFSFDGPSVLPNNVLVQYHGTGISTRAFYITPATLTITADDKEKFYGEEDPEFTVTVTGLAEGDDLTVLNAVGGGKIYTVSAGNHSENVGEYPIHVAQRSGIVSTLQNFFDNYNITYVDGKLTIKKAPIIVTVDDAELSYGQTYRPSYSIALDESVDATLTNAQRNAIRYALGNVQYNITPEPTETPIPVGEYSVAVKNGPEEIANYTITYVAGTLTVGKRLLYVVAQDQGINIGGSIDPYNVDVYTTNNGIIWNRLNWTPEQIAEVLYLSTEHTAIGTYKNAYTLNEVENASYTIDAENAFTNAWLTIGGLEVIPLGAKALADLLGVPNTPTLLSEVLEAHKGLTVSFLLPNRKMQANEWYGWVFPFDIKPSDMLNQVTEVDGELTAEKRWGYTVMEVLNLDKSKNGKVHFEPEVQLIPANTPFIVKPENDITAAQNEQIIIRNVTIPAKNADGEEIFYFDTENNAPVDAEVISADGSIKFVGLYSDNGEILLDESILYLAKASGHQHREFWPGGGDAIATAVANGTKLERTNVYLQYLNGNARDVEIFIAEPDGSVTSIKGVETNVENNVEGVYNLNGMKLQGAPAQKGVYIQNGKKVVIK